MSRRRLGYSASMRRILLFLLVLACAAAAADVYKRIGPDGSVFFSDRAGPDAEKVEIGPVDTVSFPPVNEEAAYGSEDEDGGPFRYDEFAIASPTEEEGIRSNDGNITLRLTLQPALQGGHAIAVTMDGSPIGTGGSTTIQMTNLPRGGHTVQASILDAQGKQVAQTEPVTFYVLRAAAGG